VTLEPRGEQVVLDNYSKIVGSLIYMSTTVRRDITTAVNYSARGLSSPNLFHVRLVEQIMVYLYQAKFFGLCYTHNNSLVVTDDVFHPLSRRYCDIL